MKLGTSCVLFLLVVLSHSAQGWLCWKCWKCDNRQCRENARDTFKNGWVNYPDKETITFHCNRGYTLVGYPQLKCDTCKKILLGVVPSCKPIPRTTTSTTTMRTTTTTRTTPTTRTTTTTIPITSTTTLVTIKNITVTPSTTVIVTPFVGTNTTVAEKDTTPKTTTTVSNTAKVAPNVTTFAENTTVVPTTTVEPNTNTTDVDITTVVPDTDLNTMETPNSAYSTSTTLINETTEASDVNILIPTLPDLVTDPPTDVIDLTKNTEIYADFSGLAIMLALFLLMVLAGAVAACAVWRTKKRSSSYTTDIGIESLNVRSAKRTPLIENHQC